MDAVDVLKQCPEEQSEGTFRAMVTDVMLLSKMDKRMSKLLSKLLFVDMLVAVDVFGTQDQVT